MDSSVTFRASSGRGESLRPPRSGHTRKITLEIKFEKPILNFEVRPMHEELATFRTFNFDQFPTFILRRPIRNSGEFVYVNLQRFRLDRCLASWKKKEEKKCKYFFIDVSRTFPRNILSFENDNTREKGKKKKKETIISFKFN